MRNKINDADNIENIKLDNNNNIKNVKSDNNKSNIVIMIMVTAILILIDQLSKMVVSEIGTLGEGFFRIENAYNYGIAFGLNSGNFKNAIVSALVIFIMIYFAYNQRNMIDKKTSVSLAMMIAGGISNIIDRIFRGAIFDFITIGSFPIFNLADSFIVIGWILFVIYLISFLGKKR
jgi:signal peptidase II